MIRDLRTALVETGVDKRHIHFERFTTRPLKGAGAREPLRPSMPAPAKAGQSVVTLILDGVRTEFTMDNDGDSILEAGLKQGAELPFSCKGGVCGTCRSHLREGEVNMATNYALEPQELEQGFILACQSRPLTERVTVDFDAT